ncbi:molybdopterin synthase sulfur carrier subunit [Nocardiopsis gilva YIM 90087]|uniref:Molybdopterin synthase sulfur carrier subunit n=1 Tax=Nocardiopsis gilva YIM 90087 TaxID=1235441 RepID=A0A223SCG9_9ACTN|nr:MoaD/ThiS family protein [Nocardiopsis gilva]ASU85854.1 molybdopterin synthase sulfur carrier subunit [Nocardiopsis gilva YIM 90087]
MGATVFLPQALQADSGGVAKVDIPLGDGGTLPLSGVLDELASRHPRLNQRIRDEQGRLRRFVNVYVDSDECRALSGLDTPVTNGSEVRVMPSVAGG